MLDVKDLQVQKTVLLVVAVQYVIIVEKRVALLSITLLEKYGLEFIKKHRSYIIYYTSGKKLIEQYINKKAGNNHDEKRKAYKEILKNPYLRPDLVKQL